MKKQFKNVTLYFIATLLVALLMYCIIMITILNRELEAMQQPLSTSKNFIRKST